MGHLVRYHNQITNKSKIQQFIMAYDPVGDRGCHTVYVQMDESKGAVDRNYFYQKGNMGYRVLTEYRWKTCLSSIKNPRIGFANALISKDWILIEAEDDDPEYF